MTASALTTHGLTNAEHIVTAATTTGVPLHILAAMFEKESHGRNVYGNDRGGVYSTTDPLGERPVPNEVTEATFTRLERRVAAGAISNGVGPSQITYPAYFPQARKQGVRLWVPGENILFGAKILAAHLKGRTDDTAIAEAGTLYNKGNLRDGINPYGHDLAAKAKVWADRLTPPQPAPQEVPMRDWITHHSWITRQSWPNGGLDFYPSGRMTVPPRLIVLHSTETTGFPGYNNGAAAPHFTIDLRSGHVRQHIPLSWGSRCLAVTAGGITDRTVNITGTIQIETIGAVTPGYPARHGHYDLVNTFPTDARAHGHLARLLRAIHDETGIPLRTSDYARWVVYPGSYGARASQRLSSAQFRDARGIVGHQHAPANDHGDGLYGRAVNGKAVDLEKVLNLARGTTAPAPGPKPDDARGFTPEHLSRVDRDLTDLGYTGPDIWAKVAAFQTDAGLAPDGSPGPLTDTALEDTMSKLDEILAAVNAAPGRTRDNVLRYKNEAQGNTDLYGFIVSTYRASAEAVANTAAILAALESLAGQTNGVDLDKVMEASHAGATKALAALDFQVTAVTAAPKTGQEAV